MPTVAVITSNSQLGRALVTAFEGHQWTVLPMTHDHVDITDPSSVARALAQVPDVVVNTAFTFDDDPVTALRVNALGPALLARACAAAGARLVQISTDYVFDGESDRPYRETDCPRPRSVYGVSKLAGEQLVQAETPDHLIIRVASLYGRGGSRAKRGTNFVSDMLDMARAGKQIRVVTDQVHSPTYAPDAAATVLALLDLGARGLFHVTNQGMCSKFDFAEAIFERAQLNPQLVPIRLADLPPGPARPRFTALAHDALRAAGLTSPRPWQEGLSAYLTEVLAS